jgi:hypothetical protein
MPALTDTGIKRLEARATAYRVTCPSVTGLCVKITPAGRKSYELRVSRDGHSRYYLLGHHPETPLSAAREKARGMLARLDQGLPVVEESAALPGASFELLLQAWLAHQQSRGRRGLNDVERLLRNNLSAALLAKPAREVTSGDLRAALAVIHQRGARVLANRVRAYLHGVFSYGLQADHDPRRLSDPVLFGIVVNPVTAIPRDSGAEQPRERVLSWAEIAALWDSRKACPGMRGKACRLLAVAASG